MFACIMRRPSSNMNSREVGGGGLDKELECHGFVCKSTEEAVSVAAQLYQALQETLKTQGNSKKYRLSRASSVSMGSVTSFDDIDNRDDELFEDEQPPRESPVRPPRKKKSSSAGSASAMSISSSTPTSSSGNKHANSSVSGAGSRRTGSVRRSRRYRNSLKRRKSKYGKNNNLKKSNNAEEDGGMASTYSSSDDEAKEATDSGSRIVANNGDIYTKVAMPRSKSFMKMNRGQSGNQYNLQDLFKELKDQEGIASIDDLLRQVVKPEGMSFNGIAPVYRELLLKLAMSMSKDEIFIRSKTIMDEERDKKRALLLMSGSKLLNNKNVQKDAAGRIIIQKELSESEDNANNSGNASSKFGMNLLSKATKKTFLRRKNSKKLGKNSATPAGKVGVTVGGKTASGSISRQLRSSSRRKRSNLNVTQNNRASTPNTNNSDAAQKDDKKPLTKQDIGSPMPLSEDAKTELAKKWMISDIKDIKSFTNSGPDSGVTSEGLLTNSNMTASGSTSKNKNTPSTCECGYQSSGVVCEDNNTGDLATRTQSVCSCSVLASTTPGGHKSRARSIISEDCSTCYCNTCGEYSATATCYSCDSVYSEVTNLERRNSITSIKSMTRIGDRTLAIIDTDSESSIGSFASIESPKTAWKKNHAKMGSNRPTNLDEIAAASEVKRVQKRPPPLKLPPKNEHQPIESAEDDDENSSVISDSSVASVIEAVKNATRAGEPDVNGTGNEEGYFRNPAGVLTSGAIYGFSLRKKKDMAPKPGSPLMQSNTLKPTTRRPSFRQYNNTVTSRISVDSLASPMNSLNIGQTHNIDAMSTLQRNRGPRPAYSDANMQHSLGYLP